MYNYSNKFLLLISRFYYQALFQGLADGLNDFFLQNSLAKPDNAIKRLKTKTKMPF